MIPRRWSMLDLLLVPVALFLMRGEATARHRRPAAHCIPREHVVQYVRAHGRGRGDWIVVRRAGWMVPTLAVLALSACEAPEAQPRSLTIEVSGEGLARIERTVDGRDSTEPALKLPYAETLVADYVIVRATAAHGSADCAITYDHEVIGRDTDPAPDVAVCAGKVPGALE